MNLELLNENLKNVRNLTYNGEALSENNKIEILPADVQIDEYKFEIASEGIVNDKNENIGGTSGEGNNGITRKEIEEAIENIKKEVIEQAKKEKYPVGSIYISREAKNPSEIFGGTWEKYGEGKTLVGAGEGTDKNGNTQTFEVSEENNGEYSHVLTLDEMPSHNHTIPQLSGTAKDSGAHTHTYSKANTPTGGTAITIAQMPSHTHTFIRPLAQYYADNVTTLWNIVPGGGWAYTTHTLFGGNGNYVNYTGGGQAHSHTISYTNTETVSSGVHSHSVTTDSSSTGSAGNNAEFTNMQPYVVTYMWIRVE